MAAFQETLQGFQKFSQNNALLYRLRGAINQYVVTDCKNLFQAGQAPGPYVIAASLGTILSFIPAPLLDTLLVGIIFARFRQVNRPVLLAARIIWNDLIVFPLYFPGFRFGLQLLEPYSANYTSFTIKVMAFSIGLLGLTAAATFLSASIMFVLVTVLQRRRSSSF